MEKLINPCKDCRYRHVGCHATCFLHREWKSQTDVIQEMKRKEREIGEGIYHKKTRKR